MESLGVVLDCSPVNFSELSGDDTTTTGTHGEGSMSFKDWWNAACSYLLHYSQFFPTNNLIVCICHANAAKFIYRGKAADFDIRTATKTLFTVVMPSWACDGLSMLPLALNKTLASALLTNEQNMRLLVLLGSSGPKHTHISEEVLRVVFAASKVGAVIDCFCYHGKIAPVWQQASICTGGLALTYQDHANPSSWQLPIPQTRELQKKAALIVPLFLCV